MTHDNTPPAKAVPTYEFTYGDAIGLRPDVLYHRYTIGADEEWRPATDEDLAEAKRRAELGPPGADGG